MTATATFRPASDKQFALIKRLVAEKQIDAITEVVLTDARAKAVAGTLSTREASSLIDGMMRLPKAEGSTPASSEVPEGMHRVNGTIFKVQKAVHGSGNLYAKRLTASETCYCSDLQGVLCRVCREPKSITWTFEYAPGVMKYLSTETAMTLEEAKEFGAVYGTCCACGRTLTDEGSIEAGIGPVCAKKF